MAQNKKELKDKVKLEEEGLVADVKDLSLTSPKASAARSSFKGNYELFGEYCAETEKSDNEHCVFFLLEKQVNDPKDLKESVFFVGRRSRAYVGDPRDIRQQCGCAVTCKEECSCKKSNGKCCEGCNCKCSKSHRLKLSAKDEHIMDILKAGNQVWYIIVFQGLTKKQAKYKKGCLIEAIGFQKLTNERKEDIPQHMLQRCKEDGEQLLRIIQQNYKDIRVQHWTPPSSSSEPKPGSDSDSESDTSDST